MGGWCKLCQVVKQLVNIFKVGEAGEGEVAEQGHLLVHHLEKEEIEISFVDYLAGGDCEGAGGAGPR